MVAIRVAHDGDLSVSALLDTLRAHEGDRVVAEQLFQFAFDDTCKRIAGAILKVAHGEPTGEQDLGTRCYGCDVTKQARGNRINTRARLGGRIGIMRLVRGVETGISTQLPLKSIEHEEHALVLQKCP